MYFWALENRVQVIFVDLNDCVLFYSYNCNTRSPSV